MNDIAVSNDELVTVLGSSLYPGASRDSIGLVLTYCAAAGLDPMLKPVHIVPMWDAKNGRMRDVVMPGIGLYRTQASRTDQFGGVTEPEFGPDVTETIGGQQITYPAWCRVTVKRILPGGFVAEFTAREFWKENYAVKGGKEKSIAPNAMWTKRPYGQLAKCTEAQALRKAFPELGASPTADEMEGKEINMGQAEVVETSRPAEAAVTLPAIPDSAVDALVERAITAGKEPDEVISRLSQRGTLTDEQISRIRAAMKDQEKAA